MKYISLFAGIGGFDLALQRNGHNCVYANEWDRYASEIYNNNFHKGIDEKGIDTRDIKTVSAEEIPEHDILVGGFPCQTFSIAGKRRGFDDARGTLFFEIARILRAKKPRLFILENVKGLLSHDNGNTFKIIISTLDELGYDLQWQVLNSKNFGVPQNRERVFIIGNLRGTSRPEVFPIGEDTSTTSIECLGATKGEENTRTGERDIVYGVDGLIGALGATDYKQPKQILQLNNPTHSNNRVYGSDGISPTLNTMQGGNRQPFVALTGIANTVTTGDIKNSSLTNGSQIRRLTPTECERLQGFPDGWTEGISDNQRYKCLGNAVTVNVVEYIVGIISEEK